MLLFFLATRGKIKKKRGEQKERTKNATTPMNIIGFYSYKIYKMLARDKQRRQRTVPLCKHISIVIAHLHSTLSYG